MCDVRLVDDGAVVQQHEEGRLAAAPARRLEVRRKFGRAWPIDGPSSASGLVVHWTDVHVPKARRQQGLLEGCRHGRRRRCADASNSRPVVPVVGRARRREVWRGRRGPGHSSSSFGGARRRRRPRRGRRRRGGRGGRTVCRRAVREVRRPPQRLRGGGWRGEGWDPWGRGSFG